MTRHTPLPQPHKFRHAHMLKKKVIYYTLWRREECSGVKFIIWVARFNKSFYLLDIFNPMISLLGDLQNPSHIKCFLCLLYYYARKRMLLTWKRKILSSPVKMADKRFINSAPILYKRPKHQKQDSELWKKYGVLGFTQPSLFLPRLLGM